MASKIPPMHRRSDAAAHVSVSAGPLDNAVPVVPKRAAAANTAATATHRDRAFTEMLPSIGLGLASSQRWGGIPASTAGERTGASKQT